jgi:hypothetical protein
MNLIIGGRQTGKTTALIKSAHDQRAYIVCPNERMKRSVAKMAQDMEITIPYPVSMAELPFHTPFVRSVMVDEGQLLLQELIGKPVEAMTLCADSVMFPRDTCHMVDACCDRCGRPDPSNGDARYCAYCGRVIER